MTWRLDDVFVGDECRLLCRGRGDCDQQQQQCICDHTYSGQSTLFNNFSLQFISTSVIFCKGESCAPTLHRLLQPFRENFESSSNFRRIWERVEGGSREGMGCGALRPAASGRNLYFNGCRSRQAVTREIDLRRARLALKNLVCVTEKCLQLLCFSFSVS